MNSGNSAPDMEIHVRDMKVADIKQVAKLEREIFSDPWPEESFTDIAEQDSWGGLVAQVGDQIAGYACYYVVDVEAHLANIAVSPELRRKSVAKHLLETILQLVSTGTCEYVILEVRPSSKAARAFYKKFGFTYLYRRPNYYRQPVEDAYVMVYYLRNKDTE